MRCAHGRKNECLVNTIPIILVTANNLLGSEEEFFAFYIMIGLFFFYCESEFISGGEADWFI